VCLFIYKILLDTEQHGNQIQALKPPSSGGAAGSDYRERAVTVSPDERSYGDRRLHSNVNVLNANELFTLK